MTKDEILERLVELLDTIIDGGFKWHSHLYESREQLNNDEIASYLLDHGVTFGAENRQCTPLIQTVTVTAQFRKKFRKKRRKAINMVDVKKLYPEADRDEYFCISDYQPMVSAFGKVVIQIEDDDYQGNTRVLYNNYGKIGFLVFGWGSCCGCDELQGCADMDEVQELCDRLQNDIKWFRNKSEALAWAKEKDWETEWYWHEKEGRMFVRLVLAYLEESND